MSSTQLTRREFARTAAAGTAAVAAMPTMLSCTLTAESPTMTDAADPIFRISLAQWSLHRALRAGEMDNLDFARETRATYDIGGVEYVNSFFKDKADDEAYLGQMKQRAKDHGVKSLLIMVDGEGALGAPDAGARTKAIENHHRWVRAAKFLGCHSIRVNAQSSGSWDEQMRLAADGLRRLTEFADGHGINVIVENHGGLSSNGEWLSGVIKAAAHKRCGTLPDFGNFRVSDGDWYDRYKGVTELMPYAKAVSAKSHEFDEAGNETGTDYRRMMKIVLDAGYRGFVGVEYEGGAHSEKDGILKTRDLLRRLRTEFAAEMATPA